MHRVPTGPRRCAVLLAALLIAASGFHPTDAGGQNLLDRAKKAVGNTSVARKANAAALEVDMIDATYIDLEGAGLSQVAVGSLRFGVSGVEIANGKGVRVRAYLFNPGSADVTVPVPDGDLFRLVDSKGRTLELAAGPRLDAGDESAEVTVPALERIALSLLFADAPAEPDRATLKVGSLGMVAELPVHTMAAADGPAGGVWSGSTGGNAAANPWQQSAPARPSPPPSPSYSPPAQPYPPASAPPPRPSYPPPAPAPSQPSYPPPAPAPSQPSYPPPSAAPPPAQAYAAPPGGLEGTNAVQYQVSGAVALQNTETGTVTCGTAQDGRFSLSSAGALSVRADSPSSMPGAHSGIVQLQSGQLNAFGSATVRIDTRSPGPAGTTLLRGGITAQGLSDASGPVALSLTFVCSI